LRAWGLRGRSGQRALGVALALLVNCSAPPPEPASQRLLAPEAETHATIARQTRIALVLGPDAETRLLPVVVPTGAVLHTGYGIPNESLVAGASPALFRIAVVDAAGGRHPLFEGRVDPAKRSDRRWFDVRVELARFAGQKADVELSMEVTPGEGPAPLGVFSDPVVRVAPAPPPDHPNVVVVSLDTLRARNVGAYGYARDTTPFLDDLATRGVLFEDAITASVTTGPAHMSLFTGLYPVNHGLRTGLDWKATAVETAASRFRSAGYQTAAFTEDGYIVRQRGFGAGFSRYTENPGEKSRGPGEVRVTFRQARRWLARAPERPFFLFVHTYQVHAPYAPPAAYLDRFGDDGLRQAPDPVLQRELDNYDREIRFVDDKLRELVGTLEAQGLAESTLLVVLSDHGEEFGEHGLFQHGGAVYEETLRVPLVLVGPGVPAGVRIDAPVSLIDVLPTLLDLAGLPAVPGTDGISLAPLLTGGAAPAERTLFAEARARRRWRRPRVGEVWNPPLFAVRSPQGKFIVHRPETGEPLPTVRYDLAKDADERSPHPVAGAERAALDALLDDYVAGRLDPKELREPDAPESLEPELRERLRRLGYID
jgi:arylsulfatase A-like enzyme